MFSVFIVLTETRVMLSFSKLLVVLLSDTTGSQLLILSCCLVFLHRPLRLIAVTKTPMTTIKMSMKLITPKASKVRPLSGACEGVAVTSDMLMFELAVFKVFGVTPTVVLCEERPDPSVLPVILVTGDEVEFRVESALDFSVVNVELVMMDCPDVVCEVRLDPSVLPVWLEDTGAVVVLTFFEG